MCLFTFLAFTSSIIYPYHLPLLAKVCTSHLWIGCSLDTGLSASFDCELPAIYLPEDQYWITGLCSVVRYVLLNYGDASAKGLLGHNLTTLSAPAEVSIWTKFVEIDLPKATRLLVNHIRQLERYSKCQLCYLATISRGEQLSGVPHQIGASVNSENIKNRETALKMKYEISLRLRI